VQTTESTQFYRCADRRRNEGSRDHGSGFSTRRGQAATVKASLMVVPDLVCQSDRCGALVRDRRQTDGVLLERTP